jgi:uncharacterized membrane protein YcgQ (UPF0703/DUF1980 family)
MKQFDIFIFMLFWEELIELKGQNALKLLANMDWEYFSFIFSKL